MNEDVYVPEESKNPSLSIFLAGPTPRNKSVNSWRPEMIKILREEGYTGDIFIPEKKNNFLDYEYVTQTEWEVHHLKKATSILFWIPRELNTMPGFTTNIEFGEFMHSEKIILAYPLHAEEMRYLEIRAKMHKIPIFHTMKDAAIHIINLQNAIPRHPVFE